MRANRATPGAHETHPRAQAAPRQQQRRVALLLAQTAAGGGGLHLAVSREARSGFLYVAARHRPRGRASQTSARAPPWPPAAASRRAS